MHLESSCSCTVNLNLMGYSPFHRCFHFNNLPNNFGRYVNFFYYIIVFKFYYLDIIFKEEVIHHDNFFTIIYFLVTVIILYSSNFNYVDYVFFTLNFQYRYYS